MRRAMVLTFAFILLLVGCSSNKPSKVPPTGSASTPITSKSLTPGAGDWPVYHHDNARSGVSSDQSPLVHFRHSWTSARLDSLVYAQPLVVGDHVVVASEGNTVYSLDAGA